MDTLNSPAPLLPQNPQLAQRPAIELIYADAALLVLRKPSGLLAVPGRGPDKADALSARVLCRWPQARVVHRLDQGTSGLMLMALDASTQRALDAAFRERRIGKTYEALVAGCPAAASGVIDAPIGRDWAQRPLRRIDPAGAPSLTHWQRLDGPAPAGASRLRLQPLSGRSHQLRVHLAALGHPILGDALYGDPSSAARLCLHACALDLAHPLDGRSLHFADPAPF